RARDLQGDVRPHARLGRHRGDARRRDVRSRRDPRWPADAPRRRRPPLRPSRRRGQASRRRAVIVIDLFEVPAGADDQFVETWEGAHDRTARVLYRALREDADFRFVEVASVEASEAGAYEVVHEDGVPDGSDGVALIDPFEVPETADESFLATWEAARAILASQPGYLGTRLHGSVGPSDFRFVT